MYKRQALEAGAQDLEAGEEGATVFYTEPTDVDAVAKALGERGWNVANYTLVWKAKNPVAVGDTERAEVEAFLAAMDDDDDVQNIYVGLA